MAEQRRTQDQIKADKKFLVTLLRKGYFTISELADRVNQRYQKNRIFISLSDEQIRLDIKAIRKDLQKNYDDDINSLRQESILKLNETKRLSLEAYKKSFSDDIKTITKNSSNDKIGAYTEEIIEKAKAKGNPKFLEIAFKCDIELNKLLGLYSKNDEKESDINNLSMLTDTELMDKLKQLE